MCGGATHGLCQRVEHIDRPADIKGLPQPARHRGPRVETEALRLVPRSHDLHRIAGHPWRRRDIRQRPAIRTTELKLAVRPPIDLITPLMDGAMMLAALCRAPDYAEVGRSLDERAALGVGIIRSRF